MNEELKKRSRIIDMLEQEFAEELVPVKVSEEEQVKILHILLEDFAMDGLTATLECFFLPNMEGEEIQVFTTLITLAGNITPEEAGELVSAVGFMDFFLPFGAFTLDPVGRRLVYKASSAMPLPLKEEEMKDRADFALSMAIQVAEDYGPYLIEVSEGDRTAASLIEMLSEDHRAE